MSAMYYLANLNEKKTYEIGTANNGRFAIIELLEEFKTDDKIILLSENSWLEDKYCTSETECKMYGLDNCGECFEQIDRWYCSKETKGLSIDAFMELFEAVQNIELSVVDFKQIHW